MHETHGPVPPSALVAGGSGDQVEGMRRPTTLSLSLSSLLTLGALLPACTDDGTDPVVPEAASTTDTPDDSGATSDDPPDEPEDTTGEAPDPETGDDPDPDTGDEPGTTGEPEPEPSLEEQLEGRWVSGECEPMPQADGSTLYFQRDFTLTTTAWEITGTIFGDEVCSFPLLTLDIGGDYEIVGPAAGIDGAHEANFGRSDIALTPHVQDFVDWFNGEGCGTQEWVVGETQDVSEGGCAFIPSSGVCPIEHDLVSPSGDDELYFGQRPLDGDMCSPKTRPAELGELPVLRQDG